MEILQSPLPRHLRPTPHVETENPRIRTSVQLVWSLLLILYLPVPNPTMGRLSAPLRLCPLTLCPDIPKALRPHPASKQLLAILQTLPRAQPFLHLLRKFLVNVYVLHLRIMRIVYSPH